MFHKVRAFCYADFDKKLRKSGELCKILRTEKHEEIINVALFYQWTKV